MDLFYLSIQRMQRKQRKNLKKNWKKMVWSIADTRYFLMHMN